MIMKKVYIASPYTLGDQSVNVRKQIDVADNLLNNEYIPFTPLLSHFHHFVYPRSYESWMVYCLEWVKTCDYLLRLEGESNGADMEVKTAKENNIPVFFSLEELYSKTKQLENE